MKQKRNRFLYTYCRRFTKATFMKRWEKKRPSVALVTIMRALLAFNSEKLVGITNLCLITQQINNNNKPAGICVMCLSCQRGICHYVFFNPSITAFCISQPFILHTYFSGLIHQHTMLHLHICPLRSPLKCYWKYLIKTQPTENEEKRAGELKLTLCGLSLILKVINEPRSQSNKNKRFPWLWHSHKET